MAPISYGNRTHDDALALLTMFAIAYGPHESTPCYEHGSRTVLSALKDTDEAGENNIFAALRRNALVTLEYLMTYSAEDTDTAHAFGDTNIGAIYTALGRLTAIRAIRDLRAVDTYVHNHFHDIHPAY